MVIAIVTTLALVLMITGLVLKNALLPLTATVFWVVFAFLMNEYTFTNTAISTALLVIGGFMAIMCAVMALSIFMKDRRGPPKIDEQEAYRRKVLKVTRRR